MIGTAKCSKCKISIRFIKTSKGKSMPVDDETVVVQIGTGKDIFITPSGKIIKGSSVFKGDYIDNHVVDKGFTIAYIPHWGSCTALKRNTQTSDNNQQISMF